MKRDIEAVAIRPVNDKSKQARDASLAADSESKYFAVYLDASADREFCLAPGFPDAAEGHLQAARLQLGGKFLHEDAAAWSEIHRSVVNVNGAARAIRVTTEDGDDLDGVSRVVLDPVRHLPRQVATSRATLRRFHRLAKRHPLRSFPAQAQAMHLGTSDLNQPGARTSKQIEQLVIERGVSGRAAISRVLVEVTLDQHDDLATSRVRRRPTTADQGFQAHHRISLPEVE